MYLFDLQSERFDVSLLVLNSLIHGRSLLGPVIFLVRHIPRLEGQLGLGRAKPVLNLRDTAELGRAVVFMGLRGMCATAKITRDCVFSSLFCALRRIRPDVVVPQTRLTWIVSLSLAFVCSSPLIALCRLATSALEALRCTLSWRVS